MKKLVCTPQPKCPRCGGLHLGQRFDNCPYVKLAVDPNATEEQRTNAQSWLDLYAKEKEKEKAQAL